MKVETKPVYVTTDGRTYTDKYEAIKQEIISYLAASCPELPTEDTLKFIKPLFSEQGLSLMKEIVKCITKDEPIYRNDFNGQRDT